MSTSENNAIPSTGQSVETVVAPAIDNIKYLANPAVYIINSPISNNVVTSTGGVPTAFSVSPALPMGLTIDPKTGTISGIPTSLQPITNYVVSASNSSGVVTYPLTISVVAQPPGILTYTSNPVSYITGSAIIPNIPGVVGGAPTSYTISPNLPMGLSLNATTGVISGTPSVAQPMGYYTITARNSSGFAISSLGIAVAATLLPPSDLNYSNGSAIYTLNTPIGNNFPWSSGGAATSYAVSPSLPAGLSLNPTTGVISGTPTTAQAATNYTITASNSAGSTTKVVSITINIAAPSNLVYANNPVIYTANVPITSNVPSVSGGAVTSYAVSPSLPAGLSLNATTGVISGTPTTAQVATSYTITASNSSGSTTKMISIFINIAAPSGLAYSANPASYKIGQTIVSNVPTISGGAPSYYSVAPALPIGLSIDPRSGVITGEPWLGMSATSYKITATNNSGSTTTNLVISTSVPKVSSSANIIAAGAWHSCVIVEDGVLCWGQNFNAELGNGSASETDSMRPVRVQGLTSAPTAIAAGYNHTCVIVNGSVKCWGLNNEGQLGNNSKTNSAVPVQVEGLTSGATAISAYYNHTCAVVHGAVKCWGKNTYGQLGDNTNVDSIVPVQVQGLNSGATAIAAGYNFTCAVVNGGAKCWGWYGSGQLGNNTNQNSMVPAQVHGLTSGVTAIAAGEDQTCAIVNGGAMCWGSNEYGLLGNDSTVYRSNVPVQVQGLTSGVTAISTKNNHACAIVNGGIKCWGSNRDNQIRAGSVNSTLPDSPVPVQVQNLSAGFSAISAGSYHTCAVVDGGVKCWGNNSRYQLGNEPLISDYRVVQVWNLGAGIASIAAGGNRSCAAVHGGAMCWGSNSEGQLGDGSMTNSPRPVGVQMLGSGVSSVVAGHNHTCALVYGGVKCWGLNLFGQLGNNSTIDSSVPVQAQGLTSGVSNISAGNQFSCAVLDGSAKCWGSNMQGKLGNNSTSDSFVPVQVQGLASGVTQISAGYDYACAVVNGGAKCWGSNLFGQLGNNSTVDSLVPVQVEGLTSGVTKIIAGSTFTCAIVNGGAKCWGSGNFNQLGNASREKVLVPVQVQVPGQTQGQDLSSGVTDIALGNYFACAIVRGGVKCWGDFALGGLLGTTIGSSPSAPPTDVPGLTSEVTQITSGLSHACAVARGLVRCWGRNSSGQLGTYDSIRSSYESILVMGLYNW